MIQQLYEVSSVREVLSRVGRRILLPRFFRWTLIGRMSFRDVILYDISRTQTPTQSKTRERGSRASVRLERGLGTFVSLERGLKGTINSQTRTRSQGVRQTKRGTNVLCVSHAGQWCGCIPGRGIQREHDRLAVDAYSE